MTTIASDLTYLTGWIKVYENAISDDFCNLLINFFEEQQKSIMDANWRRCLAYSGLDSSPLWSEFVEVIKNIFDRYKLDMRNTILNFVSVIEAPNIFKYNVNLESPNLFHRHADNWSMDTASRQVSIIIYLNDVDQGGETNFTELKTSVSPKKGRILMFPSFYTYLHEGVPPLSGPKYIAVSWLHFNGEGHRYRCHKM